MKEKCLVLKTVSLFCSALFSLTCVKAQAQTPTKETAPKPPSSYSPTVIEPARPASSTASEDVQKLREEDYVIQQPKEVIWADSSAHHRLNKKYLLTAQILGVGPNLVSSSGLQFGWFIDRNRLVFFEATGGKTDLGSSDFDSSNYDITGTSAGAHFKHFRGNSFYYRAGLDVRKIKYQYEYDSLSNPANDVLIKFEGTSLALNFGIGNQWQWENFTLGCDWVGFSVPVLYKVSNEELVSPDPMFDQKQLDDDSETLVKRTHLNVLRFYLGATF